MQKEKKVVAPRAYPETFQEEMSTRGKEELERELSILMEKTLSWENELAMIGEN